MSLYDIFEAKRVQHGADYKVTLADVQSFMQEYIFSDPSTVAVDGAILTALWSFNIADAPTELLSQALAEQSHGLVRTIGATAAGQFFKAILAESYEESRDFEDFPASGSFDFWSQLSRFFVENTDGPLVTITPRGLASSVYGATEINAIIENSNVSKINGSLRSEIGFEVFSSNEAAQKSYLMAMFNGDFAGDIINTNYVTLWREVLSTGDKYYFKLDEATEEALGLAGVTLDPIPAAAIEIATQYDVREDVLPVYARGLLASLFGPVMHQAPQDFLDFIGSDIDTTVEDLRTSPGPSAEYISLQQALVSLIKAIYVDRPGADISSLLYVAENMPLREGNVDDLLGAISFFEQLATQIAPFNTDAPEELKRDLQIAVKDVLDGALKAASTIPADLMDRMAVTSGGRLLFLLDEQRAAELTDGANLAGIIEGVGTVSYSKTQLGDAMYVTVGAAQGYAFLRNLVENVADQATITPMKAIAEAIRDDFGGISGYIESAANLLDSTLDGVLDRAGNPFRDAVFGSFSYASGRTVTQAVDSSLPAGDLFALQVGADEAGLIGNDNNNVAIHLGHGSVYGLGGDDTLIGWQPDFVAAGQHLDPADASSPLAEHDYRLTLDGGSGNDWIAIFGGEKAIAQGGDGDDVIALVGGSGHEAHGGAGDDWILTGGKNSHLFGGEGADSFLVGANTFVDDADTKDAIYYGGVRIYGGAKQWWAEDNTAYWAPFSTVMSAFPVIGSDILSAAAFFVDVATMKFASFQRSADGYLQISLGWGQGGSANIKDYKLDLDSGVGSGGITVFQHEWAKDTSFSHLTQYLNLALKSGFGVGLNGFDPLVLDLDGDGYELTSESNSSTYFEFDADGFGERTGWVRPDDGLLALDVNGNGTIDGVGELFGTRTTSGFAVLAAQDTNADGVIDASDTGFANLRVWQDADQDGVSDAGELKSLGEAGIASISLTSAAPGTTTFVGGNQIARTGTFTRTNGTTGGVADVAFDVNETATRWLGDNTVSASATILPQLRGFGELKDLRVAMTGDAALEAMVADFVGNTSTDLTILTGEAEAILYEWAGVDGVQATALGTSGFDTRKLAFLEKYSGTALMPRDAGGAVQLTNLSQMEALWSDQVTRLTLRLLVQGPLAPVFDGISYREDLDLLVADTPTALGDLYAQFLADLPSDAGAALAQWQALAPLLGAMADGMVRFDNNLVRGDYIAAQLVAAMDGIALPLDFASLAGALGIGDLRVGTSAGETLTRGGADDTAIYFSGGGTDTLTGGTGQDVYVFGRDVGNVVINDEEARPAGDRIRFAFLNPDEVTLARSGNDLLITVVATSETVRVTGQFAPVVPLSSDVLLSTDKGVEEIQFADGTVFGIPQVMTAVGTGTDGDDAMVGTMHSDVFLGGLGDDTLQGGDDADLYVVNAGEGHDVIRDVQTTPLLRAADLLIFGDDIAPEDLVFSRPDAAGDDLLITIGSSGQSVLIDNQFAYSVLGYNDKLAPNSRIEAFAFREYGESWSNRDIQQRMIAAATTAGADTTVGFGDDDVFGASAGDDVLIGMDGADTYHWGAGSGNDTIDERSKFVDVKVGMSGLSLTDEADTVVFGPGVTAADVTFSRLSAAPDLTITLNATGETLTIKKQFDGFQTGPLGAQWWDRVEWFEFGDGTRLSWQQVLLDVTTGGAGDDSLWGDLYTDTLSGGLGNDYLSGRGYADTYLFNRGDGQDVVEDDNTSILGEGFVTIDTTPDILRFGAGIAPEDIQFQRSSDDITLLVGGTGDKVTLRGQNDYYNTLVFGAISNDRIERVEFAGGTVWTWQQLNQKVIATATTAGNDIAEGFDLEDRFEASAGDDILRGGNSGDVYVFGAGSGHDVIEESVTDASYDDFDAVEFASGVLPGDVMLSRTGNDLTLTLATGDSLTLRNEFLFSAWYTWNDVEEFRFANGTVWSKAYVQSALMQGTSGADHLIGFGSDDLLDGGAGNDVLEGSDGSDHYVFAAGYGNDTIVESLSNPNLADADRLTLTALNKSDVSFSRDADDLVITITATSETVRIAGQFAYANWFAWNDIETFEFADGTLSDRAVSAIILGGTSGADHLVGTFRADALDGGAGNDILEGGDGADRYYFGLGYGHDEIRENLSNANLSEDDRLIFGEGIAVEDLVLTRSGNDVTIAVAGTTDSVSLIGQFAFANWNRWWDVDSFEFADGRVLSSGDLQQLLLKGTVGNDNLVGFSTGDLLDGGAGNDLLQGGDGSDTYVFGRGYGQDVILETLTNANLDDDDTLRFGPDISWSDLVFSRNVAGDLTIGISGTADSVTIPGQLTTTSETTGYTWRDIEHFVFADGTQKTKADVQVALLAQASTEGDDTILGFYTSDSIDAKGGNDVISANRGNDTILAGAGDDTVNAGEGGDSITGGSGNDVLHGGGGDDRYYYAAGDGSDVVADFNGNYYDGTGGYDRLYLGQGIDPASVTVTSADGGMDIVLAFAGTTDTIRLDNVTEDNLNKIEEVVFADGTVWSYATLLEKATGGTPGADNLFGDNGPNLLSGAGGNDTLTGRDGNDILIGGAGNDALRGDGGDDVFRFERGDGQDTITEFSGDFDNGSGGLDTVEFGADIAPADIIVTQNAASITLAIAGTTDRIVLNDALNSVSNRNRVEQVRFADGTVWSWTEVVQRSAAGTTGADTLYGSASGETLDGGAGNDTLTGRDGNDVLIGGLGNDSLRGGGGDDTYTFALGDGQDTITEFSGDFYEGYGGTDTLAFGAGIVPDSVTVAQADAGNDIVVSITGTTDKVTFNQAISDSKNRVERITFADGTVWDWDTILGKTTGGTAGADNISGTAAADILSGGAGNDTITGRAGNDRIFGGTGNDNLRGDGGNDTFYFDLGDGQDTITEFSGDFNNGTGGTDTVEFGTGIAPDDLVVSQTSTSIILAIAGTTDRVTLNDTLNSTSSRNLVEQVRFADGTLWGRAELVSRSMAPTTGNDNFYGTAFGETMEGGAGNDTLTARGGNDTLIGGSGNDNLRGDGGDDTYYFARGDGQDTITEFSGDFNNGTGGADTVLFGPDIAPEDIIVSQTSSSIILKIIGTTDQIVLNDTLNSTSSRNLVEQVRFADGTIWGRAELVSRSMAPTSGNDNFSGTPYAETLDGAAGNDTLNGRDGADLMIGGTGNDFMMGAGGDDTYLFNLGDGQDTVSDFSGSFYDGNGGFDTLRFGAGITASQVTVIRSGADSLLLSIAGSSDQVTLNKTLADTNHRIEQVVFFDGTTWDAAALLAKAYTYSQGGGGNDYQLAATGGNDQLNGLAGDDTMFGYGGNDLLDAGDGNDTVDSGGGHDIAYGRDGNDVLKGGLGDDKLDGGAGDDLLQGDGWTNLIVNGSFEDRGSTTGDVTQSWGFQTADMPGWTRSNTQSFEMLLSGVQGVAAAHGNYSLDMTASSGAAAKMNISQQVAGLTAGQTLALNFNMARAAAGGNANLQVLWNGAVIAEYFPTSTASSLVNLNLVAIAGANTLGFRTTQGPDYDGVYIDQVQLFSTAAETGGNDYLAGGDGADTLEGGGGVDLLEGGTGNDTLRGEDGDDVLKGGSGNDSLDGGAGNDTLLGDGQVNLLVNGGFEDPGAATGDTVQTWGKQSADLAGWTRSNGQWFDMVTTAAGVPVSEGTYALDMTGGAGSDGKMSIAQRVTGLGADQALTLSFDLARPLSAGSSALEVLWNGTVVATYASISEAVTTVSLALVAQAGTNTLGFRQVGGPDNIGVMLDNVWLYDTEAESGGNDRLTGGAGNDVLNGGVGTDVAVFAGLRDSYTLTTVGGTIQVVDTDAVTDGDDGTDTLSVVEVAEFKGGVQEALAAPIVLDLDGDGVTLLDKARSGVRFDWDGDSEADRTGWAGPQDGMLVYDRNGDGTVSGADELTFVDDKAGARSDLDGLSAFDSDADGVLSASDAGWSAFHVWQDANLNGSVDAGELRSLGAAGIQSIDLDGSPTSAAWEWGENVVVNRGAFTRTDGTRAELADVALSYSSAAKDVPGSTHADDHARALDATIFHREELVPDPSRSRIPRIADLEELPRRGIEHHADLARKLALMRQDLGVFGSYGMEMLAPRRDDVRPMDLFV